mgnify:CR=1 FL=1
MRLSNPYTLEQTLSKLLKAIYTDTNAVALLEKALDKAKSDTVYAKQLEEALLKGSTIECREVFCAFGHYFQRSDTFPWYAHADAINAIDTALYYVKAGFLDADGNKREVPDLNDSVSLEISAAIAETMQDGSEEITPLFGVASGKLTLDELVDEILLSSRLDATNADIGQLELVELTDIARDECRRMPASLNAPDITMVGSTKLLRRLLRNLIENAHKYAKPVSLNGSLVTQQVEVSLTVFQLEKENWVQIQVDDNGPGVPEDQRERIFEPFYRMRGASEKDGGVGLGLALVQSIAKRHGGKAVCQSAPSGGARFIVKMPLMPLGAEE